MRELKTPDLFAFVRLIDKIGLKEEIQKIGLKADPKADIEKLGADILFMLLEKCTTEAAEQEIYKFFAPIFEVTVEEIKDMNPFEFFEKVKTVASLEKWKSFFSSAAKLTK